MLLPIEQNFYFVQLAAVILFQLVNTMNPTAQTIISSPIGDLYCAASDGAVTHILFTPDGLPYGMETDDENPVLKKLRAQLDEYFCRARQKFDISISPYGTKHQLAVWAALTAIPYGQTIPYAQIASQIDSAPIAVGQAVGKNRINIVIPCHRVIGSNGSLTGYGGGLERKRFLLNLERR